jgi:hypothetical protein
VYDDRGAVQLFVSDRLLLRTLVGVGAEPLESGLDT